MSSINELDVRSETIRVRRAAERGHAQYDWLDIYLSVLEANQKVGYELHAGRHAWLQVLRGAVDLNGYTLAMSDGAAVSDQTCLSIRANESSEVMLFDLA